MRLLDCSSCAAVALSLADHRNCLYTRARDGVGAAAVMHPQRVMETDTCGFGLVSPDVHTQRDGHLALAWLCCCRRGGGTSARLVPLVGAMGCLADAPGLQAAKDFVSCCFLVAC